MAMTDIGTGTYTILAQIAAEMLVADGTHPDRTRRYRLSSGCGLGWVVGAAAPLGAVRALQSLREKLARIAGMDPAAVRLCRRQHLIQRTVQKADHLSALD